MPKSHRASVAGGLALLVLALIPAEPFAPPTFTHNFPSCTAATAQSVPDSSAQQPADDFSALAPGQSIQLEIAPGASRSHHLTLAINQFVRLSLAQWGADLSVALYAPGGRKLFERSYRQNNPAAISVIADAAGVHRLEIRSLEKDSGGGGGRYELRIEETRAEATPADHQRIAAETTSAEAEQLRADGRTQSQRRAIEKHTDALALWRASGAREQEADALKNIGEIYVRLGEPQTALTFYRQSLVLSKKFKLRRIEGETLNDIGYAHLSSGENQKALEHCTAALELARADGNRRLEAHALNNIGETFYGFGKLQQSIEYYRQSLSLWQTLGDRRGQAAALVNLGYTFSDLSETQQAFDAYTQAHALWRVAGDQQGQAVTLTAIGRLYSRLGESQKALNLFNQALQLIQPLGDAVWEASTLNGIGYVYEKLGEKARVLEHYTRALELYRAASQRSGEATTLYDIGRLHYSLGDNVRALDYFRQALAMSRTLADERLESYALRETGMAHDALGDKRVALGFYQRALAFNRKGRDRRGEADTLNLIGRIQQDWGERETALENYNRALPLNRAAGDRFGESLTLYNIARVERDRDHLAEARTRAEAALATIESLRTKVASEDLRASYFASVHQHYELYIDVLMRLHRARPSEGFDAAALEASERARARSLLETLAEARADIRQGVDPALLEHERALQQRLNLKAERRMQLGGSVEHAGEEAALAKEIDAISGEYDAVRSQIREVSPHYAALTQPQPLGIREIQQQVLDDDTLLLEFSLGDERSYLWAVTPTGVAGYELPNRAEIERAARLVYDSLTARQPVAGETFQQRQARAAEAEAQYRPRAARLSNMLLAPVANQLGTKRLLIVADGILQYVPFAALPVPDMTARGDDATRAETFDSGGDSLPLVVEHEIVNLPSASTLAVLRRETAERKPAPQTAMVFADPVFDREDSRVRLKVAERVAATAREQPEQTGAIRSTEAATVTESGGLRLPPLPASREEADAIMAVMPDGTGLKAVGFAASRAAATDPKLAQYRIVHFATHGILDSEHPELSGIVLSLFDEQGHSQDGFLRLHDIYNLHLPAELVVLSACNTGLGKDIKGEGLVGLTRGFMYAGAAGVMASLWKVDDDATLELMKGFYERMLRDGASPAVALRQSQIAMWRRERWHAPYYWAAFVLQGEYKSRAGDKIRPARISAGRVAVAAGAFALALSLGGVYAVRRRRRHARQS